MKRRFIYSTLLKHFILLFCACLTLVACNKPFPDTLETEYSQEPEKGILRKTLLIIVDGAVGSEVKAAMPPTLNSLVYFSILSWDGLKEYSNTAVSNSKSWTTLLTGANPAKHQVN